MAVHRLNSLDVNKPMQCTRHSTEIGLINVGGDHGMSLVHRAHSPSVAQTPKIRPRVSRYGLPGKTRPRSDVIMCRVGR